MVDLKIFESSFRREVPPQLLSWLGEDAIAAGLNARFAQEVMRTTDPSFGQAFFEGCPVAGCAPEAYQQRVLPFGTGHVWTGIRFLGGNVDWPFVDIVASTQPLDHTSQWDRLVAMVHSSYAGFEPRAIRVYAQQMPRVGPRLRVTVDQQLLAGHVEELSRLPEPPNSQDVGVKFVDDAGPAAELVARAYGEFYQEGSDLADALFPATADELTECVSTGILATILVDEEPAGVIATRHDLASHFYGQCVVEQVLIQRHRGRGFAAAAQRRCIETLAKGDRGVVIWGTIDSRNSASIATARRVGREQVGAWYWLT